jgi:hypothetical protein
MVDLYMQQVRRAREVCRRGIEEEEEEHCRAQENCGAEEGLALLKKIEI